MRRKNSFGSSRQSTCAVSGEKRRDGRTVFVAAVDLHNDADNDAETRFYRITD